MCRCASCSQQRADNTSPSFRLLVPQILSTSVGLRILPGSPAAGSRSSRLHRASPGGIHVWMSHKISQSLTSVSNCIRVTHFDLKFRRSLLLRQGCTQELQWRNPVEGFCREASDSNWFGLVQLDSEEWCRAGYNSHFTIVEDAELSDLPPSLFLRGQAH